MINDFLAGAVAMGFAIAALMFLKFWRRTREGLFLAFAGSFFLLSLNHAMLSLSQVPLEERSTLYIVRLAAFLLIIGALWHHNRGRRST